MEEFTTGFFDDDGNPINPFLEPKQDLCLHCRKNYLDDAEEDMLCAMNRWDQRNKEEFECGAFEEMENPSASPGPDGV